MNVDVVTEIVIARPELEKLPFALASALRAWLAANHDTSPGIWLMIAKKGSGVEGVTYDEAVDEGLCFGVDRRTEGQA